MIASPKTVSAASAPKSNIEILNLVATGQLSADDAAKLLKQSGVRQAMSCKVSEKGAVSIYGLGRFPVTLYRGQLERLIEFVPTVQQFIADNASKLSVKE